MHKQILGYQCKKCGHVHYPYRSRCRKCGETTFEGADIVWDTVPLPSTGKLLTYTDVYALPGDFEAVKLTLGIVELDGGLRITGQLRIDKPKTGMRVRGQVDVVRTADYTKHWGMIFYPGE